MTLDYDAIKSQGDIIKSRAYFYDEDVLIFDNLKDINIEGELKVDSYILALCTKGRGSLVMNGKTHNISQSDLLICRPNHILENLMQSVDFECTCVCVSQEFMQNILTLSNSSWDIKIYIENNPVIHLDEEETALTIEYAKLLKTRLAGRHRKHHKEMIAALLKAVTYDFNDMLDRFVETKPPTFSSAEKTFNEFFDLLTSTLPRQRSVVFYANRLNITPKHLSVVCKKVSGKSALQFITEYAIRDIQNMLLKPEKSIKEIASALNFDNISYFGKYFRHNVGMSPKQYREIYIRKEMAGESQ